MTNPSASKREIIRSHDWRDAKGRLRFQHRKYSDGTWGYRHSCEADFCSFHPDAKPRGGWCYRKPPVAAELLWNMPDLVTELGTDNAHIFWCAGEKDAERLQTALADAGVVGVATSTHQGETKPPTDEQLGIFSPAIEADRIEWVALFGDRDDTGYRHLLLRYEALLGAGLAADRIELYLPAPTVNDVYDHLSHGHGREEFRRITPERLAELVPPDKAASTDSRVADTVGAQRKLKAFRRALTDVGCTAGTGQDWTCPHPDHDDQRPSFGVDVARNGGLVINCQVCEPKDKAARRTWIEEILDELGLEWDAITPDSAGVEDDKLERQIALAERQEYVRVQAQDRVRKQISIEGWEAPKAQGNMSAQMQLPAAAFNYAVDGLLGALHNGVLAAQYKAGKTTLGLNLVRCAVDGESFLGQEVQAPDGNIAYLNGEMEMDDFLDYGELIGIRNTDRVFPLHLRGARLPLLSDVGREWFIDWCKANDIRWVIGDSWRRICTWSGVHENKNNEVDLLTDAIDQIKAAAGITTTLWLAHTGRVVADEGTEHVRGATSLDDWADVRWIMARGREDERETRYFYAEGRRINFEETALEFDEGTYRITLGTGNRRDAKYRQTEENYQTILDIVAAEPGITQNAIVTHLADFGIQTNRARALKMVKEARDTGVISASKKGQNFLHYPPSKFTINHNKTEDF